MVKNTAQIAQGRQVNMKNLKCSVRKCSLNDLETCRKRIDTLINLMIENQKVLEKEIFQVYKSLWLIYHELNDRRA